MGAFGASFRDSGNSYHDRRIFALGSSIAKRDNISALDCTQDFVSESVDQKDVTSAS